MLFRSPNAFRNTTTASFPPTRRGCLRRPPITPARSQGPVPASAVDPRPDRSRGCVGRRSHSAAGALEPVAPTPRSSRLAHRSGPLRRRCARRRAAVPIPFLSARRFAFLLGQPWTAGTVVVGRRAVTLEPSRHPRMGHKSPLSWLADRVLSDRLPARRRRPRPRPLVGSHRDHRLSTQPRSTSWPDDPPPPFTDRYGYRNAIGFI